MSIAMDTRMNQLAPEVGLAVLYPIATVVLMLRPTGLFGRAR